MKSNRSSFAAHLSSSSSGFTLMEILLVIVLMMFVFAIGIPSITGTRGAVQMRDATRTTMRVARYARSMAILKQDDCTLLFTSNRVQVVIGKEIFADRRLPEKINVSEFKNLSDETADEHRILYYPSGLNDGFELTLTDNNNRECTIICHPYTGNIKIKE